MMYRKMHDATGTTWNIHDSHDDAFVVHPLTSLSSVLSIVYNNNITYNLTLVCHDHCYMVTMMHYDDCV